MKNRNPAKGSKSGGATTVKRYGKKHMAEIGRKSHAVRMAKYGPDYYAELGRRSAASRQKMMDAGKAALAKKENTTNGN